MSVFFLSNIRPSFVCICGVTFTLPKFVNIYPTRARTPSGKCCKMSIQRSRRSSDVFTPQARTRVSAAAALPPTTAN